MSDRQLASMTWPDVASGSGLLAVPLGACEQHGPHLPLGTDSLVAQSLAEGLAARRSLVTVAPPLPYGASGEHAGFAGTLSIGTDALRVVLVELVRSADSFDGVVLVCGHGGNATAVTDAVAILAREGREVLAWAPSSATAARATGRAPDAHAGHVETSVVMALAPHLAHPSRAAAGNTTPLGALLDRIRAVGVVGVSSNGVLGDPQGASADDGRRILAAWTDDLDAAVGRYVGRLGRLGRPVGSDGSDSSGGSDGSDGSDARAAR